MKIQTLNHSLIVSGLEFDSSAFGGGTLAGFENIVIDGVLSLSYDDLMEMPIALSKEIFTALETEANKLAQDWQDNSRDLRAWLAYRRG